MLSQTTARWITLAQVDAEQAEAEARQWYYWFTHDPLGQKIALGVGILIALGVLYMILSRIKVAKQIRDIMIIAAVLGGALFATSFFGLSLGEWTATGFVLLCLGCGFYFMYSRITSNE